MYEYICDGCSNHAATTWDVKGSWGHETGIYLCNFCRIHYYRSPDFREDVKEWAQVRRDNNLPLRVWV